MDGPSNLEVDREERQDGAGPKAREPDPTGLGRYELLDDISNAAIEYLMRGFDAFERCVLTQWKLEGEEQKAFLQWSLAFFKFLREKLDSALATFEEEALQSCLYVVPDIAISLGQQAAQPPAHAPTEEEERQLDADVETLTREIQQARLRTRRLQADKEVLIKSLALHGDSAPLEAIVNLGASKENILEDAVAIAAGGLRLKPLLSQAEALEQDFSNRPAAQGCTPMQGLDGVEREIKRRQALAGGASAGDVRALMELLGPK